MQLHDETVQIKPTNDIKGKKKLNDSKMFEETCPSSLSNNIKIK